MTTNDSPATETKDGSIDGTDGPVPETLRSCVEKAQPFVARHGRSGTLALAAGGVSILRGIGSLFGDRKRALGRLLWGGAWIFVGLTQRRLDAEQPPFEPDESRPADDDRNDDTSGVIAKEHKHSEIAETAEDDLSEVETSVETGEATAPDQGDAGPEKPKDEYAPADDVSLESADEDEDGTAESG